ncbi:MAG: DnaJ domain-containing protein [Elusimicrobia bacterium]|nr:DnaJ domain-containing protein [Elusimicrobiota bacterium]
MTPEDAYRALGLPPGAGAEAAQEAYRRAALEKHPDRAQGVGLHDKAGWLKIRDAYEFLRAAGFPAAQAVETPKAEPKRYRAPEWLERKWANEKPERLAENLNLDEAERRALVRTIVSLALAAAGLWGLWHLRHRAAAREFSPRPGWSVRW